MFSPGDIVIHPSLGVGEILSVEERVIQKKKKQIYNISINGKTKTKAMVPADRAVDLGLRQIIQSNQVDGIFDVLASDAEGLPENSRQRKQIIEDKLHTSEAKTLAELVRDISWHQHLGRKLNQPGRVAYKRAFELLVAELATVQHLDEQSVRARLNAILKQATV